MRDVLTSVRYCIYPVLYLAHKYMRQVNTHTRTHTHTHIHTHTFSIPVLFSLILTSLSISRSGPWNRGQLKHVLWQNTHTSTPSQQQTFSILILSTNWVIYKHNQHIHLSLSAATHFSFYISLMYSNCPQAYFSSFCLSWAPPLPNPSTDLGQATHLVLCQSAACPSWCTSGLTAISLYTRPHLQIVHALPEHSSRQSEKDGER